MLNALIFDVDGTLADTEAVHRRAFNLAFSEVGQDWTWDDETYCRLLQISGGKERILHYWREVQPEVVELNAYAIGESVDRMHALKTAAYERLVQDGAVELRPGVLHLIESANSAGLRLAIATTTTPLNIATLLRKAIGPDWRSYFQVIEDASTAPVKKPHPQVYLQTLSRMQIHPRECLAFEDSFNGLHSATSAGLKTLITPTRYTEGQDFSCALRILPSLAGINVCELREWHQMPTQL